MSNISKNNWINHCMRFSKENNIKYPQALSDMKCKEMYNESKKTPIIKEDLIIFKEMPIKEEQQQEKKKKRRKS